MCSRNISFLFLWLQSKSVDNQKLVWLAVQESGVDELDHRTMVRYSSIQIHSVCFWPFIGCCRKAFLSIILIGFVVKNKFVKCLFYQQSILNLKCLFYQQLILKHQQIALIKQVYFTMSVTSAWAWCTVLPSLGEVHHTSQCSEIVILVNHSYINSISKCMTTRH